MAAARFFIEGRVQGVFFRASAREQATELGLRGYARNLHDGRVEVLAVGDVQALERLAEWLKRGPAQAHVTRVERIEADDGEAGPDFDTA
jgi:acylphosphatase